MRILGIDLGSSSIKAVEIDSAFGRYDIHDYHEHPVIPGSAPEEAAAALIQGLAKTPDRIVVALKTSHTTFRNLQLPTRDKKAIQAGVGFELEDELPFPTEDSNYDYAILTQNKQGSTIHVAATMNRHLVESIQMWNRGQIDPDILSTEAWAYRILLNRVLGPTGQELPILLVQIGHENTTFYLHWKGAPALIREIHWGGKDLTVAICQHYQIPMEQAESIKLDRGALILGNPGNEITPEQRELSDCLEKALDPLASELKQTDFITKSITRHTIHTVYLAGGTSLLPGIGPWIEARIQAPVQPLRALSATTSSGVTYSDQTDARFLLAASLALCLVGPDRALCINFRKGDFSKEGKARELNLKALTKPLTALGVVAFCLFLSLVVQSTVYKSRLASTDAQLERSARSFFGQMSSSALRTYMANPASLKSAVDKELNKQRELNRLFGPNAKSPLDFLSNLSATIPKDIVVDLIQYQEGSAPAETYINSDANHTASLTFLIANPQLAERLGSIVGNKISNMQRGKMEEVPSPDGNGKKWKITFSGKPTEDSYVK
jgi:type IV pilus assembly protein PilM